MVDEVLFVLLVAFSADAAAFVAVDAVVSDRCANSTPSSSSPAVVLRVLTIEYNTSLRKPSLTRQYRKVAFIRKKMSLVSTLKYGTRCRIMPQVRRFDRKDGSLMLLVVDCGAAVAVEVAAVGGGVGQLLVVLLAAMTALLSIGPRRSSGEDRLTKLDCC